MLNRNRIRLRWVLAIFSLVLALLIVIYDGYYVYPSLYPPPTETISGRPYNELTKAAMDLRVTQSTSLFQFGLLITGTLWALVIAKRDEVKLVFSDRPEICMFIVASGLLVASAISYSRYLNDITYVYVDSGNAAEDIAKLATPPSATRTNDSPNSSSVPVPSPTPSGEKQVPEVQDIFDSSINYLFVSQYLCLASGLLVALITLVSAHKIRVDQS